MKIPMLSAQQHRRIDLFVLPGLIGLTYYMRRRNKTAGAFTAVLSVIEATAFVTTDFPPGILPWLSFRDHIKLGLLIPWAIAAAACLSTELPAKEWKMILAMLVMPVLVNSLSDVESGT